MHALLMIITLVLCIAASLQKTSPCPSVFVYDERDDSHDTWFGTIRLKSNVPLHGVFVDIVFSSPVAGFGTFLQQHYTEDSVIFHVTDKSYQVRAGEVVTIKFYVRYSAGRPVPLLQQIRFNGQNICTQAEQVNLRRETSTRDQTGPSLSSRETAADIGYSHVVQPIVPQHLVESSSEPKYNSTNSARSPYGAVATREVVPPPIHNSPTHNRDKVSSRFNLEDEVEYTSSLSPIDPHAVRRVIPTASRNVGTTRTPLRTTTAEQLLPRVPLTANHAFATNPRATTPDSREPEEKEGDQFFAGDFAFIQKDRGTTGSNSGPHYISDGGDICGTVVPKPNPLVTHGLVSENGQFPWHGALYRSMVTQLKYLCGATLISRRASVTAAHCVTLAHTNRTVDVDSLLVYFGKIELDKWNGPEQDAKISSIHIPAEYNHQRFYQDMALLLLKDDVQYSSAVRPICLWSYDTDYKSLINKVGLVPGWGYNDRGLVSSRLSYAQMPVVSHETCIWSNRNFFSRVTSDTSFCAGFKNGTSVCNGDSGGGMVFKISNRWYLRGIVSVSAALQDLLRCNVEHYVVFTDAAKFTAWIKNILEANG